MTEYQKDIEGDIQHYLQDLNITFMAEHKELDRVSKILDNVCNYMIELSNMHFGENPDKFITKKEFDRLFEIAKGE